MRLIGYGEANAGPYSHTPRNNPACNLNLQPAIRESDQFYSISIKLLDNCLLCPIGSLFRTAIQQFTSLPINGRIEFLECFDAISNRTTSRSCKRNYRFAVKFILLNKRVYRTGAQVPPDRISQQDHIIHIGIQLFSGQFRDVPFRSSSQRNYDFDDRANSNRLQYRLLPV